MPEVRYVGHRDLQLQHAAPGAIGQGLRDQQRRVLRAQIPQHLGELNPAHHRLPGLESLDEFILEGLPLLLVLGGQVGEPVFICGIGGNHAVPPVRRVNRRETFGERP
jgi:hypothetical protein